MIAADGTVSELEPVIMSRAETNGDPGQSGHGLDHSDELRRASALARAENIPMHLAERKLIGTSHAEVGAYMLGLWGLPHAVVEAIAFQHRARDAEHKEFDVLAALATALCLTAADAAAASPEPASQHAGVTFDDDYLQSLNAPFSWTEARQCVEEHSGDLS